MNCRTAIYLIALKSDLSLTPLQQKDLDAHLAACHRCRLHAADIEQTLTILNTVTDTSKLPAILSSDFESRLHSSLLLEQACQEARPITRLAHSLRVFAQRSPAWACAFTSVLKLFLLLTITLAGFTVIFLPSPTPESPPPTHLDSINVRSASDGRLCASLISTNAVPRSRDRRVISRQYQRFDNFRFIY